MAANQIQKIRTMKNRAFGFLLLLTGIILTGCSGKAAVTDVIEITDSYQVLVTGVTVKQGDKIELSGTTTLPEGNCVYTQLLRDGDAVDWWPVGKCFPITGLGWQFSIPLGKEGAPDGLDHEASYTIKVWWPGAPEVTRAEFPFDLAAPPAP